MSQDISLEEIVRKIVLQTGLSREEIMNKIDEAVNNVNGLLTRVGAALVLADKLKVDVNLQRFEPTQGDLDQQRLKIRDIIDGMRNIILFGRIASINPPRTFQRSDGRKGKVASMMLQDDTGTIKVTLWDEKATLLEGAVKQGEIIGVFNGYTKVGIDGKVEINVNNRGTLKPKPDGLNESDFPAVEAPPKRKAKISEINDATNFCDVTVQVIEKFEPRTFQRDGVDKQVARVKVGDETGSSHVVFWTERMNDYHQLQPSNNYSFQGLGVKKDRQGSFELHVNRATVITPSSSQLVVNPSITQPSNQPAETILDFKNIPENGFRLSVKGTVIYKSDVSTWNKDGRQGSVARLQLLDGENYSINVVFWTEMIDAFSRINVGDVVAFSNLYSKTNRGQVELNASRDVTVTVMDTTTVSPSLVKIADLKENLSLITIEGRVHTIEEERAVPLKDGSEARVINFTVVDETGAISVVAWREQVDVVKNLSTGTAIKLESVNTSFNSFRKTLEARLTRVSKIQVLASENVPAMEKLSTAAVQSPGTGPFTGGVPARVSLDKIEDNMRVEVLGRITNVGKFVNHYIACPQCNKKVIPTDGGFTCNVHGKVNQPSKRLIARVTVDDGTGYIPVTTIGNNTNALLGLQEEQVDAITEDGQRDGIMELINQRLVLKSFIFRGRVKYNEYRSEYELIADTFNEVDYDDEVVSVFKEMESAS